MISSTLTETGLIFRLTSDACQQVTAWQQTVDLEVIRYQILHRGQAMVVRYGAQYGLQKLTSLPALGEAEAYYGMFGGAYRYTFQPTTEGCDLEVCNQMGGFAYFYPDAIPPLNLHLSTEPELVLRRRSRKVTAPLEAAPFTQENGEMIFRIPSHLYINLSRWAWYGRSLDFYRFIFVPTTTDCLVRVWMPESEAMVDLVKEERL